MLAYLPVIWVTEQNLECTQKSLIMSYSNNLFKYLSSISTDSIPPLIPDFFLGFQISDNDFHGIRQLLKQLFPKENLDTSALSNLLISQNFIGTVLKQSDVMLIISQYGD